MKQTLTQNLKRTAITLWTISSFFAVSAASAGDTVTIANDPLTVKECSACHAAFGPHYLRSYAWQKIMGDLSNHFGEDASLDEATRRKIEEYYVYNAGRPRKIGLRISEKKWFVREHGSKRVRENLVKKGINISNCTACHKTRTSTTEHRPN